MMKYEQDSAKTSSFRLINQQQLTSEKLNARFMIKGDDDEPFMIREFDSESYRGTFRVLGSCNGLVLLLHHSYSINKRIYLWNPATRFYNKVFDLDNDLNVNTGGLCFDSSNNVYKAVIVMERRWTGIRNDNDGDAECVIVASLKDKKWRKVECPYDTRSICDGITMYGRIHYRIRVSREDQHFCCIGGLCNEIICFDPVTEKFDIFPVPESKSGRVEDIIVGVGVLNECLCMTRLDKGDVEILVMKEYGVKESWTSLFFVGNLNIYPWSGAVVPLFMTDNGELILMINSNIREKNVILYDPKNGNMQDIQLVDGRKEYTSCTISYVESLISPKELLLE